VAVLGLGRVGHGLSTRSTGLPTEIFPNYNAVILSYPIFFLPTAGLPSQKSGAAPNDMT